MNEPTLPASGRATWLPPAQARIARLTAAGWSNHQIALRTGIPALRVNTLVVGLREHLRLPESASRAMLVHHLINQRYIPAPAHGARPALVPMEARIVRAWALYPTRATVAEALGLSADEILLWTQTLLRKIRARNVAHLVALGHALHVLGSTDINVRAPLPLRPELLSPARATTLGLLARGMPPQEIATHMGLAPDTVASHLKAARRALGCPRGTALHVLVHRTFASGAATPPTLRIPAPPVTATQLRLWRAVAANSLHSDIARAAGLSPGTVRQAIARLAAHAGTDSALGLVVRGHAWNWNEATE
ncbi:helix-turn-helix transcriptional regulator [Streptomyces sp. NPDC001255]|uniref:helix-turn-helix transcriptional regulator n=1 Tax=Streptomyces sp. NPDC001255 TaxID=3364550 RepID=UPI00367DE6D6